jgi:hypothetical protein
MKQASIYNYHDRIEEYCLHPNCSFVGASLHILPLVQFRQRLVELTAVVGPDNWKENGEKKLEMKKEWEWRPTA